MWMYTPTSLLWLGAKEKERVHWTMLPILVYMVELTPLTSPSVLFFRGREKKEKRAGRIKERKKQVKPI